jgi:nucleotide-binding universal stress UspA family protein
VAARGSGGFARLRLGSVGTQLTHHARCPVVIIPPDDMDR